MAITKFSWGNYLLRLLAAVATVFATYNPTRYSYIDWLYRALSSSEPLNTQKWAVITFCGVVLVIAWAIFLRATYRSLGLIGTTLAIAFFASLIALVIVFELLPEYSETLVEYLVLIAISGVLSIGISWSHVRRRVTGQIDVDEADV